MSSIKKLLLNGIKPVGKTMYIYGGSWNKEDTGAGKEAITIGLSSLWKEFADKQTSSYDYKSYMYMNNLGLDCSGYIGWTIYNTLKNKYSKTGYVYKSTDIGKKLSQLKMGNISNTIVNYKPGDILCSNCNCCKHVWLAIGQCSDKSVVLLHSSPPGVMLSGTTTPDNKNSEAIQLAQYYMHTYYPKWFARFPQIERNSTYLTHYYQFRWYEYVLSDNENYSAMSVENILKDLFNA